ncbi:zinc-dependent metalloprotease [Gordonia sp. X0973]|uniref:zinc-dependent metalloprotease n=1 Tax=Gordonia sp. X0973 TaxID=2742602 RepID=UPI0026573BE9|nr:zinc-dependent metalloprotease [Gordonia sp. X0973]
MTSATGADRPRPDLSGSIDWRTAATVGRRLARSGPAMTDYTRDQVYAELADAAVRAEGPVREVTGLADGLAVPTARIVDRGQWIGAAADSMRSMIGAATDEPEVESAADQDKGSDASASDDDTGTIGALMSGLTAKAGGFQAGGLLAFLSGAILGQYDPFTVDESTGADGVLLLVAPNIVAVERKLKAVPSDFRLWVCLHEVTHRVQFSANPWLRGYMVDNVAKLTDAGDETAAQLVARIAAGVRGEKPRESGVLGVMQLLQSPEQYEAFTNLMMLGTLLEGHADHVMDAVGPAHVPTVERIRAGFDARRAAPRNPLARLMRALIGMDAKMAQYIRGKAFTDHVVGAVGMPAFNTVWTGPETLPRPDEIDEPDRWISRVL